MMPPNEGRAVSPADGTGGYWVDVCAPAREGDRLVACACGAYRPAQMGHGEMEWHPMPDLAAPVVGPICVAHERPWPCPECEEVPLFDLAELGAWWMAWRGVFACVVGGVASGALIVWALGVVLGWGLR